MYLKALAKNQLTIKTQKCCFFQEQVKFLGHVIQNAGTSASSRKIDASLNMPELDTQKKAQRYRRSSTEL